MDINKWKDIKYPLYGVPLSYDIINSSFEEFFKLKVSGSKMYFGVLIKIRTIDGRYLSISKLQIFDESVNIDNIVNIYYSYWDLRSEDYHSFDISHLIISYFEFSNLTTNLHNRLIKPVIYDKLSWQYRGFSLPITLDFSKWGYVQLINNLQLKIYTTKGYIYHVIIKDDYYDISLYLNNNLLLNFIDTNLDKNNITHFKRTLNDKTFIYLDGFV